MKTLGVDPGQRRVGLAVAEDDVGVAVALRTVTGGPAAVAAVAEAVRAEGIDAIVVGLPLRLDGTEGVAARRARAFGEALGRETGRPVRFWDERMTTVTAERALSRIGVRGRDRRSVVDQSAAVLLLQGYLDAHRGAQDEEAWVDGEGPESAGRGSAGRGGRRSSRGR